MENSQSGLRKMNEPMDGRDKILSAFGVTVLILVGILIGMVI